MRFLTPESGVRNDSIIGASGEKRVGKSRPVFRPNHTKHVFPNEFRLGGMNEESHNQCYSISIAFNEGGYSSLNMLLFWVNMKSILRGIGNSERKTNQGLFTRKEN